jgi:hypothetical protein
LAVLVPRPRINLLLYHGVLAAHARGRAHAVRTVYPPPGAAPAISGSTPPSAGAPAQRAGALPPVVAGPTTPGAAAPSGVDTTPARPPRRYWAWADLLRRIFAIDVLGCSQCGGRLRLIATIEDPAVVTRILRHLGLPTELPDLHPARPPPVSDGTLALDFSRLRGPLR